MMQYFSLKKSLNVLFFDAFSLSGRNRDWRQRRFRQEMTPPPNERGIPRGCVSSRLTLIHDHNIWMCDDDLHQQICMRPNGVLARSRKREKSSHRKSLLPSLWAIFANDLQRLLSINNVGSVAAFISVPLPSGSSLRQLLHLCLLQVTYISRPEFLLCKCEPCVCCSWPPAQGPSLMESCLRHLNCTQIKYEAIIFKLHQIIDRVLSINCVSALFFCSVLQWEAGFLFTLLLRWNPKCPRFSGDSVGRSSSCLLCPYRGTDPELRPPVTSPPSPPHPPQKIQSKPFLLVFNFSLHAHRVRKVLDPILAV